MRKFESLFVDELSCHLIPSRRYLQDALGVSRLEINRALDGTMRRLGMYEMSLRTFELSDPFLALMNTADPKDVQGLLFRRLSKASCSIKLEQVSDEAFKYAQLLLQSEAPDPIHILLYGNEGTGKTTGSSRKSVGEK